MIEISDLVKTFHRGSINEVLALSGIALNVRRGDFITVIGSKEEKKSTLLNCLAGSTDIDSGHIHVDEENVTHWPEHKRATLISRVFQDPERHF